MKLWEYINKYGLNAGTISNLSILIYHSDIESIVIQRKYDYWEYDRFVFLNHEAYEVIHLNIFEKELLNLLKNEKLSNATIRVQPININLIRKIKSMVKFYGQ